MGKWTIIFGWNKNDTVSPIQLLLDEVGFQFSQVIFILVRRLCFSASYQHLPVGPEYLQGAGSSWETFASGAKALREEYASDVNSAIDLLFPECLVAAG